MTLIERLEEMGRTGLDLSPGDELCREAAEEIRRLEEHTRMLREQIRVADEAYNYLMSNPDMPRID